MVAIDSESYQSSFPSICALPSEISVLLNSNLSRRHFLRQVAFHLQPFGLQALVAIYSESRLTSFPRFCTQPSEDAVLSNSNLSGRPVLGQVVKLDLILCTGLDLEHADLDLLLCIGIDLEHAVLILCHIFSQRPMNDHKIE